MEVSHPHQFRPANLHVATFDGKVHGGQHLDTRSVPRYAMEHRSQHRCRFMDEVEYIPAYALRYAEQMVFVLMSSHSHARRRKFCQAKDCQSQTSSNDFEHCDITRTWIIHYRGPVYLSEFRNPNPNSPISKLSL